MTVMRRPLNRGPSSDQPADEDPRFIAFDAPEPPESVLAVAILEMDPNRMRWERVRVDHHDGWWWLGAGTDSHDPGWPSRWEEVGRCWARTQHDLKDVTGWLLANPEQAARHRRAIAPAFEVFLSRQQPEFRKRRRPREGAS